MGKFQSKLASKRRQSPEGGSLASSVLTCQRELESIHKTKLTENLYVELRGSKSDRNCNLQVVLPPKTTPNGGNSVHFRVHKQTKKRSSHAGYVHTRVTECNMLPDEDTQQEWVFTLYNFDNSGKVTKEDMSSLIHSMYEVLEASVKQPHNDTTPLKIKLVITPSADPENISQIAEKDQSASQQAGPSIRRLYSEDENIERRNHYLDLAGIENYTSKFDNTESPSQEPGQDAHSALKQHHVVIRENCISPRTPRGLSVPQKSKAVSLDKDRNGGEGKSCRLHGHHPVSWCHPSQSQPAAHSVLLQRTHSKRLRSRVQDTASHLRPTLGGDRDIFPNLLPSSPAQRHDHHHHHEHHHHHHHHYHPS
ncbi:naked cuticle-like protein 3 isoform X2 [Plectropomus leopardus]|uniref:naked cuticle-like protein 3 isoform X2 n=1 Tax=Plectropomus leopardus TaxID=160734 RepID=UPI001C4B70B2|nr:naked cuticle-like protein 3 isoform X2 [Plectropomus leopardus]